eukprot:455274-Pelagomonas_calceolata.AAC.3
MVQRTHGVVSKQPFRGRFSASSSPGTASWCCERAEWLRGTSLQALQQALPVFLSLALSLFSATPSPTRVPYGR